ncbi:MAG: efflux RND transporter periplasmic adaptor subunit [Salibacteraceae bacterium]
MKNIINNKWVLIGGALIIGFVLGKFMFGGGTSSDPVPSEVHEHVEDENGLWTCSMHPQIQKDAPGKCPICGMTLVPVDVDMGTDETNPNEVTMSAEAMALAEVQTFTARKEHPEKELRLLGKVKADERLIYSQTSHLPGRIEELYINFTGEKVYKGQKLASIYSPELITAQQELIEVISDENSSPALLEASREKLRQWKLTDNQISEIEKSKVVQQDIDILSNYNGFVMKRLISEGDHVMEGMVLFEITDLSKVWVLFEAYENDLPWLKLGDEITIDLKSLPGQIFKGKVAFIDPFINPQTRVAYVRVELDNSKGLFKPDMFANGIMSSRLKSTGDVILIPKSAVLWTGKRAVVYVKVPHKKHNTFIYREVVLGAETGDYYIISSGLMEGEVVASNGVFKIDASAQLAGKKSMMSPDGGAKMTGHEGMEM